jgi:hypothetical protein
MKLQTELMIMLETELHDIDILLMSLHPHFDSNQTCPLTSRKKAFTEIRDFVKNFENTND